MKDKEPIEMKNVRIAIGTDIYFRERRGKKIYHGKVVQVFARHVLVEYPLRDAGDSHVKESFLKTELLHNSSSSYLFLKIKQPASATA